jgi:hypothetical protein
LFTSGPSFLQLKRKKNEKNRKSIFMIKGKETAHAAVSHDFFQFIFLVFLTLLRH